MKEELKKNLLIVNSHDRKDGTSDNFKYGLGETSIDIEGISLKSAIIPHTYSNVNSTNNVLKYSKGTEIVLATGYEGALVVNGIVYSYITSGGPTYSQEEFLNVINNSDLQNAIQVSYNSGAGRYEIETINNVDPGLEIIQPTYQPTYTNLWTALGFTSPTTLGNTIGSITQAPNAPVAPFDVNPIEYFEVAIPEGQYTLTELLPEVANALTANISGTLNVFLNTTAPNKGRVEITGASETWKFEESEIARMLGYIPDEMVYSISGQVAQGVPDMYGQLCIFINSKTLMNGYNALQVNDKTSVINNVPVCSSYEGIDKWQSPYPIWKMFPQSININEFDIFLTSDRGEPLDLKGASICLVFEILTTTRL
jgi:hypothetical protein